MSTNLNYKQVANVERRTWDLEAYEKRAKERTKGDEDAGGDKKKKRKRDKSSSEPLSTLGPHDNGEEQKEEFQKAAKGSAGPAKSERAFLKARKNRVDVDSKIGSVEMINPEAVATTKAHVGEPGSVKDGITKTGVGWHCKVCDCFLRDSHTYLDHINGRKHQRNLGYSMRVERSTKDQVSSRLAMLTKEKEKKKDSEGEESFYDIVKAKDEEARRRKEERDKERKERKKMKKLMAQQSPEEEEGEDNEQQKVEDSMEGKERDDDNDKQEDEEAEVEEEEINPDLAAMMGFSGFR